MTIDDAPLIYVYLRGKFLVEVLTADGTRQRVPNTVWAGSYARPLFKRLLSATGRRTARSDLIDDLWPQGGHDDLVEEEESREKLRERYLSDAASKLRQIFHNKEIITGLAGGYQLAGPPSCGAILRNVNS